MCLKTNSWISASAKLANTNNSSICTLQKIGTGASTASARFSNYTGTYILIYSAVFWMIKYKWYSITYRPSPGWTKTLKNTRSRQLSSVEQFTDRWERGGRDIQDLSSWTALWPELDAYRSCSGCCCIWCHIGCLTWFHITSRSYIFPFFWAGGGGQNHIIGVLTVHFWPLSLKRTLFLSRDSVLQFEIDYPWIISGCQDRPLTSQSRSSHDLVGDVVRNCGVAIADLHQGIADLDLIARRGIADLKLPKRLIFNPSVNNWGRLWWFLSHSQTLGSTASWTAPW